MSKYIYDFYFLKRADRYFGHMNYHSNPTVFAFRKPIDVEKVKNNLCNYVKYDIDDHHSGIFKIVYENPKNLNARRSFYEIERMGYFDMCLHITLNNLNVHIIDDIIEDDETNMYLMNCGTTMEPVFVNDMMYKMHLNKILSVQKINEG